jgi:hypothetical protein
MELSRTNQAPQPVHFAINDSKFRMKALLIERHGPHADLQVHDVPASPLRPREVRVEVHALSLSVRPGGDRVSGHAAHVAGFGEAK